MGGHLGKRPGCVDIDARSFLRIAFAILGSTHRGTVDDKLRLVLLERG